ncbi:MAG: hypothetical protein CL484_05355 [Acidobacteria bacterium]|nr:hypothetical protein [Acidobacteriota bacterium]
MQLLLVEYLDSPELSLSTLQVGSLLELDKPATRELLQASITTGLLDQTQEGYFVLADHYQWPHTQCVHIKRRAIINSALFEPSRHLS